jgi:hypothetical protein
VTLHWFENVNRAVCRGLILLRHGISVKPESAAANIDRHHVHLGCMCLEPLLRALFGLRMTQQRQQANLMPLRLTREEFHRWAEGQRGRFERIAGEPVAMSPERA